MTVGLGVGLDLVEVDRFERALRRWPGLRSRLFTDAELMACESRARPARHLAARFCAKEAVIKALGIDGAAMRDIEIAGGRACVPEVRLHGAARQAAGSRGVGVAVSLTHERGMAAAAAVVTPA